MLLSGCGGLSYGPEDGANFVTGEYAYWIEYRAAYPGARGGAVIMFEGFQGSLRHPYPGPHARFAE